MEIEMEKLLEKTKEDYFAEINDEESFKNFLEIYEKTGNEEAEFFLGEMYYLGYGTEKDLEKAYKIMTKLFDNDRRAREKVASMYIDGVYVEQDNDKAFEIYKSLVEDGEDTTGYDNYMLGLCFKDGYGTNIDLNKAFELIKKGAELGWERAYFWLGYMYFHEEGTEANDKEAEKWLLEAIKYENENTMMAEYILGVIYLEGHENGIEIKPNKEYGLELIKKSAEKGYEDAINKLNSLN